MPPTVVSRCLSVTQRKQDLFPQEQVKEQAPFFALRDVAEAPTRTSCEGGRSLCRARAPRRSPNLCRAARSSPPAATPIGLDGLQGYQFFGLVLDLNRLGQ